MIDVLGARAASFFRYKTLPMRRFYAVSARLIKRRLLDRHRRHKNALLQVHAPLCRIDPRIGYAICKSGNSHSALNAAIAEALMAYSQFDYKSASYRKAYLIEVPIKFGDRGSAITSLALDPQMIATATQYLGMVPILGTAVLWYSPNEKMEASSSQYFHLDHEDTSQLKIFVHISDVDSDSGPLTVLDAESSAKVARDLNYRMTTAEKRIEDDIVKRSCPDSRPVELTGNRGTLACVDTSRCLHFGSRSATRPRLVLMIQYLSPFAFSKPKAEKSWSTLQASGPLAVAAHAAESLRYLAT
jgi:hypothetical protein